MSGPWIIAEHPSPTDRRFYLQHAETPWARSVMMTRAEAERAAGEANDKARARSACPEPITGPSGIADECGAPIVGHVVNLATGQRYGRCTGHLHNIELPPGWRLER